MIKYLIQLLVLFLLAFSCAHIITKFLVKYLLELGIVDKPSSRRLHINVTPRGGGISLVVILTVGLTIFEFVLTNSLKMSGKIIPPFLLISFISFLDDLKGIKITTRLIFHLICSNSLTYFFFPVCIFGCRLPHWVEAIVLTIVLTGFLNIYNFMDGIDAITAVESIHLSITILSLCVVKYQTIINVDFIIIITIIILAYSINFLIFNWYPAMIFLGDVGSISLGFIIGICLILLSISSKQLFIASIISTLYYLSDSALTIFIRLVNKEKIWQPHLKHFFQKAVQSGMKPKEVVNKIIYCNFLLMLLSIFSLYYSTVSIILAILIVTITLINFNYIK